MVYLSGCPVCKGGTLNQHIHDDCESASFQDILLKVQNELKKGKAADLPEKLRKQILELDVKSLEEFLEGKRKKSKNSDYSLSERIAESLVKKK